MRNSRRLSAALEEVARLHPDWFEGYCEPEELDFRSPEPDPAEAAEAQEHFERLLFAISFYLNPHWQFAMIRTLEGDCPAEIAAKMRLPLFGVKLMIKQAGIELRELLADDE